MADGPLMIVYVVLLAIAVVIVIAWVVMPLVIFSRLKKMSETLALSDARLREISKSTADVAKFFNERDVKVE